MPRQTRTGAAASACDWAGTEVTGDVLLWQMVLSAGRGGNDVSFGSTLILYVKHIARSLGVTCEGTDSGVGSQDSHCLAYSNGIGLQGLKDVDPEYENMPDSPGLVDVDPNLQNILDSPGGGFLDESIGALFWLLRTTVESLGIGLLDTGLGMDSHKGTYGGNSKASGQPSVSVTDGTGPPSGGLRQDKVVDRARFQTRGGIFDPNDLGHRLSSSYGGGFLDESIGALFWLLRTTVESLGISLLDTGLGMDSHKGSYRGNSKASGQPSVSVNDGTGPPSGGLRQDKFVDRAMFQTRGGIFDPNDLGHRLSSSYGLEDVDANHQTMPDSPGGGFLEESMGALLSLLRTTVESLGIDKLGTGVVMDSHKGGYGGNSKASDQPGVSVTHGTGPPSGGLRQDKFVDRARLQTRGGVIGLNDLGHRLSTSYGLEDVDANHQTMPDSPGLEDVIPDHQTMPDSPGLEDVDPNPQNTPDSPNKQLFMGVPKGLV